MLIEFIVKSILIGVGATVIFDLWVLFLARTFGLPGANWTFGGRWFAHIPRGTIVHESIATAAPIAGETAIGWIMHYVTGIVFAAVLILIWGLGWTENPTLGPAMVVGITTVLLGWFVMSPGMGGGIAASRRPNAWTVRGLNLAAHVVFGLGLWVSALLVAAA
ncbi:DUF2938 domain-containing protein [Acuticoccus mangrovi]|uniref:DUF2938 domain-containing protein n=1 Tax=Acuticoccus mangrovi TaxID=2796142 RepID=A0A934IG19_9HYPH|nr:DUF2938 domain-containing protein [Acuticoccus mangrovi]MBJ3775803.1 DUF2938 domain-containing protein [Acuticoccus mangrovi]